MDGMRAPERTILLADGRRLGFAEYGDRSGQAVLGLHGTPGSRLMFALADQPARRQSVRLIAPDRPGFGLSDPMPTRRYLDGAADLEELLDQLGQDRVTLVGVSGGGPYALAAAAHMPARVTQAIVVSGVAPVAGPEATGNLDRAHRILFGWGARAPRLLRAVTGLVGRSWRRHPDRVFERVIRMNLPADRAIMSRPEVRAALTAGLKDAFVRGGGSVATEIALFGRPWGFSLRDVRVPVRLFHGAIDRLVPARMGRHLAALLPRCQAEIVPDAGHYWVFDNVERLLKLARQTADVDPAGSGAAAGSAVTSRA